MTDEIYETPSTTPNFQTELAAQLADLIPEAVADGKVDVEKLKELLDGDVADSSERFGLFWPGKKRALRAAQEPTTATLKPDFENSKDWDTTKNVFIEGDNLEVLKILQKHYHAKIKMIYIDPPYNTGKDFVYPDNYKEGLDTYLEWTRQVNEDGKKVSTNAETEGRYHSNWLNMMYPRLKLARNLLTDDGVIFVSIDDHEYDNLKKLMDLVFGETNYLNTFVWVSNLKGRQISASGAAGTKEYILCYARRGDEAGEFRSSGSQLKALMPTVYKGFNYTVERDEHGPYVLKNELYNTNSAFNEVTRPNLVFDIYYNPETRAVKTAPVSDAHLHPGFVKISPKRNNNGTNLYHAFRWSTRKVETESHNLAFLETPSGWKVYTKVRDVDSAALKDIVTDITTNEGSTDIERLGLDSKWFDYPKPVSLIKVLVEAASSKDAIVLDFFAGSATTAQAVMELNADDGGSRRFIQVQLPEPLAENSEGRKAGFATIADVAAARIRAVADRANAKMEGRLDTTGPTDFGFRAYTLADTNFAKWRLSSDVEEDALQQHLLSLRDSATDDATADDLLTEILLKQGYSLTEDIAPAEIGGLDVRLVRDRDGDIAVLAYLNEHVKPTLEQLRALVDESPTRIIVLEDAFQGDDELKTNLAQLAKSKGIELWTA
ncbi:site-specific DNA-methyltransferase [Aestuariimicrobium sp. p3-SID1156]|uniref:site-specific DNA-methyltransferase n=1 Tax=Aestuariimicrobium sp. p3-SID1156 TaxID=2916038 RepID=UPI00223C2BEB|nr:site-specific DNA-methyltransferase [Aestuariimicrobium sp. p3-SID1156]MCT1460231.1 site-specific DNA-methyltransferase [Aestuariimicrobium sp. p3-SID1156]